MLDNGDKNQNKDINSRKNGEDSVSLNKIPHQIEKKETTQDVTVRFQAQGKQPKKAQVPVTLSLEEKRKKAEQKQRRKQAIARDQRTRTFIHVFSGVLLSVFLTSVSIFLAVYIVRAFLDYTGIARDTYEVEIEIPAHADAQEIAQILADNHIIDMPSMFVLYAKLTGKDATSDYIPGTYIINSAMSYSNIIQQLQTEYYANETVTVRVIEGMTAVEIGQLLEESFVCKAEDFLKCYKSLQNKYEFELRLSYESKKFYQLEGYLFPDTYEFFVNRKLKAGEDTDTTENAKIAANKMFKNFDSKFDISMYKHVHELGLTLDEFITLASMVQAEAATIEDMRLVASVFLNRIRDSETFPYLQSDPTHLYAEEFIVPYTSDMSYLINYDTYKSKGIPPGPICNPGLDAMEALIYATPSEYYYFCANPNTLEIYYAKTLEEHEANLIKAGLRNVE